MKSYELGHSPLEKSSLRFGIQDPAKVILLIPLRKRVCIKMFVVTELEVIPRVFDSYRLVWQERRNESHDLGRCPLFLTHDAGR